MNRAKLLAGILSGTWRHCPPPLDCSAAELGEALPLLIGSGTGALAWWKVRPYGIGNSSVHDLEGVFRRNVFQSALRECQIQRIFGLLEEADTEALLVKGWAAARLYPDPGLRPAGDIDLCVDPAKFTAAEAVLKSLDRTRTWVDLHRGFHRLDSRHWSELHARAQSVSLGDTHVRIPSPEDHLRILCLHLLRHGAWRPLWLCDVAAALESRPNDFDWDYCLGKKPRTADWVACAIGLAHQLLGARIDDTPVARRARNLPGWLIPAVLKQWEAPYAIFHTPMKHRRPMISYLAEPAGLLNAIRSRWPNPIAATISVNGPFNEIPRLAFQLGNCLSRSARFLSRLPIQLSALRDRPKAARS